MGTRRLFIALALTVASVTLGASLSGCGAHSRTIARCGPAALRLSLQSEGESGTAIVFAFLLSRNGSACIASGTASFEIEQNRERAKIQNNPLSIPVHLRLSPGQRRYVNPVDWSNWCGSRRHLDVVVHFNGLAKRYRFTYLPRCDQPGSASQLIATSSR